VLLAASLVGNIVPMAVVIAICQSTFQVNFELLGPMWSKLSPAIGVGRLFSLQSMVQGITFIGKQTLIVVVAAWFLMNLAGHAWCVSPTSLADTVTAGWRLGMWLLLCLSTAYLFVACVDYAWRWWNIEQELKMTRQELKEEHKQEDVDPQLKSRIRKLQREAVRRGMVSEIPRAAVVITNPTHLAIAIRYRRGEMSAPTVIAKGAGVFAKRIVKIARDNGIPVVERKSLARALFALVDVQQEIPPSLYRALAEILAYIYRLERR
jgi:flagellar biosynthetic protein FlhB